jgi:hypothetical protein
LEADESDEVGEGLEVVLRDVVIDFEVENEGQKGLDEELFRPVDIRAISIVDEN